MPIRLPTPCCRHREIGYSDTRPSGVLRHKLTRMTLEDAQVRAPDHSDKLRVYPFLVPVKLMFCHKLDGPKFKFAKPYSPQFRDDDEDAIRSDSQREVSCWCRRQTQPCIPHGRIKNQNTGVERSCPAIGDLSSSAVTVSQRHKGVWLWKYVIKCQKLKAARTT